MYGLLTACLVGTTRVRQGENGYQLQENDGRYSVFEFLVHGFVMPYFHAKPSSNASSDSCQEEQCGFGDAPPVLLGLEFIYAIYDEGNEVDGHEIDEYEFRECHFVSSLCTVSEKFLKYNLEFRLLFCRFPFSDR